MKKFSARQLHATPSKVYIEAHRAPVIIKHANHGELILLSSTQIFSKNTNMDGSLFLHVRPSDLPFPKTEPDAA